MSRMLNGYGLVAFGLTYRAYDLRLTIICQLGFMHVRNDIMRKTHKVGQHEYRRPEKSLAMHTTKIIKPIRLSDWIHSK